MKANHPGRMPVGRVILGGVLVAAMLGCSSAAMGTAPAAARPPGTVVAASDPSPQGAMTMDQTLSDQAQLTTIAFDGLAFLTGSLGADSFFPPGKVADWWGFQYLRDNDASGMGHNTDFLTKASLNMLNVLTPAQRAQLTALAKSQVAQINTYGYNRFALMTAFRRLDSGDLPSGATGLSEAAVKAFSSKLYQLDGAISLARAKVMGPILAGLTDTQRAALDAMKATGMTSWPNATEPAELAALSGDEKVAVMTYAGDLYSWYAGDVTADVYFCPERQGTYFGSFYMKDAPAVGNPGYSIGTNITADMGNAFLAALTPEQAAVITNLVNTQRSSLTSIVGVREQVATQLRKYISGGTVDEATLSALMGQYGELDGEIVYQYATAFAQVGDTLSDAQRGTLAGLRTQTLGSFTPSAAFLYSHEIAFPTVTGTDSLFGVGTTEPQVTPAGTPTPPGQGAVTLTVTPTQVTAGRTVTVSVTTPGAGTVQVTAKPTGGAGKVIFTRKVKTASTVSFQYKPARTSVLRATFRPAAGSGKAAKSSKRASARKAVKSSKVKVRVS